jgi:glyoxalase family protein
MRTSAIAGFHHVTALCGDPQRNLDFYSGVLGLRLVKRTVNFDDPSTYHLYYGDGRGTPGTILTFFAWPGARHGHFGVGQVAVTALRVPTGSLSCWADRLRAHAVVGVEPVERQGAKALAFADPDGMRLELAAAGPEASFVVGWQHWPESPVPAEHAIRGLHGVMVALKASEATVQLLTEVLGFRPVGDVGERRRRYATNRGDNSSGVAPQFIDLVEVPDGQPGSVAVGTVHHIAWRVEDDAEQAAWREKLIGLRFGVSPVMDRTYFHSIYFREPGGVLFEIATDRPGFIADGEGWEALGRRLQVPTWLEGKRELLEQALPPLRLPGTVRR